MDLIWDFVVQVPGEMLKSSENFCSNIIGVISDSDVYLLVLFFMILILICSSVFRVEK